MKRLICSLIVLCFLNIAAWGQSYQRNSQGLKSDYSGLMDSYDVLFYHLNLDVTNTNTHIEGNTLITIKILKPTDSIVFQLSARMLVDSVIINGATCVYSQSNDFLIIKLLAVANSGEKLSPVIYYKGTTQPSSFFSGLSSEYVDSWSTNVTWTLSEPYKSKEWFPCKQVLTDKADSAYIFITTDAGLKAGSNGLLTEVTLPNGKVRHEWRTRYPIAYYLISLAVSNYDDYSFYITPLVGSDSMLVQNYIYKGYASDYSDNIRRTGDFIKLYSELFGLYPYAKEKYGHCMAPLGGGMEHSTMTTIDGFDFDLVSHELAHQWFGDNVTCSSFQDIWINEGFASYLEYLCEEKLNSLSAASDWMFEAQASARTDGSVFVPIESVNDEYRVFSHSLTYKKGAAIIHILRHEINNDTLFFNLLRDFQAKYSGGNASGADFRDFAEQRTNIGFHNFFEQWYYGKGYPVYNINWSQKENILKIVLKQTGSSTTTPFFNLTLDMRVSFEDGTSEILKLKQDENNQLFEFPFSKKILQLKADPDGWLIKRVESVNNVDSIFPSDTLFNTFPNPFRNKLTVWFRYSGTRTVVTLTDINGKTMKKETTTSNQVDFDCSELALGSYLVNITQEHKKYVLKVIKK